MRPLTPLFSPAVSVQGNGYIVTVTGAVDCSAISVGTLVYIGNYGPATAQSGTTPDENGISTIQLTQPWHGPDVTDERMIAQKSYQDLLQAIYLLQDLRTQVNPIKEQLANEFSSISIAGQSAHKVSTATAFTRQLIEAFKTPEDVLAAIDAADDLDEALTSLKEEDSEFTVSGMQARLIAQASRQVDGIKNLRPYPGITQHVSGFYQGSAVGGGAFIYDPTADKARHNGGTVIAPEALEAWDGTFEAVSVFLHWQGSGTGCYIRQGLAPFLRQQLYAEMFGSPETNPNYIDETAVHQRMWDLAMSIDEEGAEIQLFRLYAVNGLRTDGVGRRGVRIFAASGVDYKRGHFVKGYCPSGDNQECILKFGGDEINGDSESTYMEGVTIYGRDKNFTKAMVWCSRLSQGAFRFCAFRRARAPALYMQKLEDWDFYNCNFGSLCGNDGRGAIVFGQPPILNGQMATVGNNAIRFNQGRIEFVDGPMVTTEGPEAWASTVTFIGTKFESGPVLNAMADPLGSAEYGQYAKNYPIFKMIEGNPIRITVRLVAGCSFSGVSIDRCAGMFRVYRADEISCTDTLISGTGNKHVKLFDIQGPNGEPGEIYNFIFKHNSARVFAAQDGVDLDYLFVNRNRWAVDFEYPIAGNTDTNKAYRTAGKNFWFMSEHAARSIRFDLVENPNNSADPCLSPGRTVLTNNYESSQVWFRLNAVGLDGQLKGWLPTHDRVSVNIRAKHNGNSQYSDGFRVAIRDDAGELGTISINSTTMQWHRSFVQIPAGRGVGLRFVTIGNLPESKVFIDAVEIVPAIERHIDYQGSWPTSPIQPGETFSFNISVPGLNPGMFYIFSYENTNQFPNARITSYVDYGSNLRVQIENLNNTFIYAAQIFQWKVRRFL